ncbi:MAG: rhomboid family intramembrane serine protease [Pirellulales bacterium]|nr:rhomboid family intramembrane serine protease [Pirellulales bacterium]
MGIYDREYIRREEPGIHLGGLPQTFVMRIVLLTFAVYVLQLMTGGSLGWWTRYLALEDDIWRQPWKFYKLLTYGFLHDPGDLWHILFNMFGLWMFGRSIEQRYGSREFLAFYLAAVVLAGLGWLVIEQFSGASNVRHVILGASGGVVAIMILFALNYPRQTVYLMGIIPLPMWVVAIFLVIGDLRGATVRENAGNVAYTAHLAGAAVALVYYQLGWRLSRFLPSRVAIPAIQRGPKLSVHTLDDAPSHETEDRVDDILRKIQREGQESLTRRERKILEDASREYQRRRPK